MSSREAVGRRCNISIQEVRFNLHFEGTDALKELLFSILRMSIFFEGSGLDATSVHISLGEEDLYRARFDKDALV